MSKIAFGKNGISATEVPQDSSTAVATRETLPPPAVPYSDENISLRDIILPRLNIVQKVGELSNVFSHGSILLNGELEIYQCNKDAKNPNKPLTILVLGFQPSRYVEKIEGGGRGDSYSTPAEVVAAGGTIDYNEAKSKGIPLYQESATALVLLEKPEGIDDTNFPYTFNGKQYCTALWTMKGTAFTHGAKVLKSARVMGKLRYDGKKGTEDKGGYRGAFYTFGTKLKSFNNNWYYEPVLQPGEFTTPEFRDWIKNEVVGF